MKLQQIQCTPFNHAKDLTVSPSYIAGCTGRKAVILDRQYRLVQTIDGLEYVYRAHFSPDEKQLLLISNANKFYIADLASGMTRKAWIRSPFRPGLEGEGCWSHDGQYVYIPVVRSEGMNSTLRRYRTDNLSVDAEFLHDEYWITNLSAMKTSDSYFMIGLKRDCGRHFFITMKADRFDIVPLNQDKGVIFRGCLSEERQEIGLWTTGQYMRYSLSGKLIQSIENAFASGESAYQDMITKYAVSQCGKYSFMSTNSGFYLLDAAGKQLQAHIPQPFGVQNFEQLEPDVIALATWRGVKLYRMLDE